MHSSPLLCVRAFPCIFPDLLEGHALSSNKDMLIRSTHNHSEGNIVLPTTRNPTPNDPMSSWDFLPRRSPNMLAGLTPSTFLALEGGPNDKLSPQNLF